ncbi:MAG: secretion protein HlyD [Alphaproteobacteria bacterium]
MTRRIVLIIGLVVAAGLLAAWWFGVPARMGWVRADTAPLTLYGNVDIRQVPLGFRVDGRIDKVLFDEGDSVAAGAVIARLDTAPLDHAAAAAKAEVEGLRATLDKLIAGPRPSEIAQAEAALNEARADLRNVTLAYERAVRLRPDGTISQAGLDEAGAARAISAARAASAGEALELLKEGTRAEDIAAARANLASAEARFQSAQTSLDDAALRAPHAGVILSRVREPGAIVAPNDIVTVLSLQKPVWVRAYISEVDLGRIHPGMAVDVTSDTRPDAPEKGRIGFISPVAEFTPKSVETPDLRADLVYRLRIVIDDAGPELRQGMPVTIRLPLEAGSAP